MIYLGETERQRRQEAKETLEDALLAAVVVLAVIGAAAVGRMVLALL